MENSAAKNLAAAVIRSAVEDLQGLQKKIMLIKSTDRQGNLASKIESDPKKYDITPDELSALSFLRDRSPDFYFEILDIYGMPKTIKQQIEYCEENVKQVQSRVRYLKGAATKKKNTLSL